MQDTQTDPDNCRRLRVDEPYMKFQPSPNIKNMKKFLISKIDNSESSSHSPPNGSSEHTTPNNVPESPPANQQEIEKQPVKPVIHPALPLHPLPVMPVPMKNEIIDTEYQDQNGHESPKLSTEMSEIKYPEVLPEVRNAGVLSTRHLNFQDKPSCVPVSKLESKPTENDFRNMLQAITSPLKREWSTIESVISPPRDLDDKENLKKCKHCITMDIRERFNKEKLENMANSTKELQLKAHMLSRKSNFLYSILCTLVKQEMSTVEGFQKISSLCSTTGAKDWEIILSSDKT